MAEPTEGRYRQEAVQYLADRVDLRGRRVLEVGGDAEAIVAKEMLEHGAAEVVVTNIAFPKAGLRIAEGIGAMQVDARRLETAFGHNSFDVCFGVAVMEHIPDTPEWIASMMRVLRSGGHICVHGGPIWSGPHGHHVWVIDAEDEVRFSNSSNPIPHWSHLLGEDFLGDALISKGLPYRTIRKICDWVYRSKNINRAPYSKLMNDIKASGAKLIDVQDRIFQRPSEEMDRLLRLSAWGPKERYEVSGVTVLLQTPHSG
jgi:SAM-dependent methyltransferase